MLLSKRFPPNWVHNVYYIEYNDLTRALIHFLEPSASMGFPNMGWDYFTGKLSAFGKCMFVPEGKECKRKQSWNIISEHEAELFLPAFCSLLGKPTFATLRITQVSFSNIFQRSWPFLNLGVGVLTFCPCSCEYISVFSLLTQSICAWSLQYQFR